MIVIDWISEFTLHIQSIVDRLPSHATLVWRHPYPTVKVR